MARQVAIWFHRTFGRQPGFSPGPFIPPPAPVDDAALAAELEHLRRELQGARLDAETARAAAEAEARRRMDAEERARRDAEEAGQRMAAELAALRAHAAAQPPEALRQLAAESHRAGEKLELDEADTRRLIDAQLREAGWEADSQQLTWERGVRPVAGRNLAIAEWPTSEGRADYILFVGRLGLVYRLVKANRFRRILFLVDRSALGQQAADTFQTEFIDGSQTFATIYDVKELKDAPPRLDGSSTLTAPATDHFRSDEGLPRRARPPGPERRARLGAPGAHPRRA
jgi:hypothetical protein